MHLPADTHRQILTAEDLARIDRYAGTATDLHELLPAVLPLRRARYFEAAVVARHGTPMTLSYLAEPHPDGIAVSFAAASGDRAIAGLGPTIVTATDMTRPEGCSDAAWRELRSAAGITLRALYLWPMEA